MTSREPSVPARPVTFLLTDIEGSTSLLASLGPQTFGELRTAHHRIVMAAVGDRGVLIGEEGDGLLFACPDSGPAISAAITAQADLGAADWPGGAAPKVRMALHRGLALAISDTEYVSMALHQAARLMAGPHGGQIICTDQVLETAGDPSEYDAQATLLGAFWLRDFADATRLYQLSATGHDVIEFPPLRVLRADLTNIPAAQTDLVGRDAEIDAVRHALETSRLVTLTGPGGVGKTRLAADSALHLARRGEAAWMLELAAIERDGSGRPAADRIVSALAQLLGVPSDSREAVLARLSSRSVVLIIDNCEHLLDAATDVVDDILSHCPDARILATSREPLGTAAERIIAVSPLSVPAPGSDHREVASCESIRLLTIHARRVNPSFEVTADNAEQYAEVCRELDGLPLAPELAGAATRYMSAAEMLERLRAVGTLPLAAGRRRSPRHTSLDAVLDWSLASCTDTQRAVFRRLSAFAGPAVPEAVVAVCSGGLLERYEVMDALAALVDKQLVVAKTGDTTTRYDLLMTLRRAAARRLEQAGEAKDALLRHAQWVLDLTATVTAQGLGAIRAAEEILIPETLLVLDRSDRIGLSDADCAALLASRVLRIGVRSPGLAMAQGERLLASEELTPQQRNDVLTAMAQTAYFNGDPSAPKRLAVAVADARRSRSVSNLIRCLILSEVLHPRLVDDTPTTSGGEMLAEARELLETVTTSERTDLELIVTTRIGAELTMQRNLPGARQAYEKALRMATDAMDVLNEGVLRYNLAEVEELAGNIDAAVAGYAAAAATFARDNLFVHCSVAQVAQATVEHHARRLDAAADTASDAVLSGRRSGSPGTLESALLVALRIAADRKDVAVAHRAGQEILTISTDPARCDEVRALLTKLPIASVS